MKSQERLLTIFLRLQNGEKLSKTALLDEFSVSPKTIQRDMSTIRDILKERQIPTLELQIDNLDSTYYLNGRNIFNKKEILVVSKILLENRTFNKPEMSSLLDNLLDLLSKNDKKVVECIIGSERLNYESLKHGKNLIDIIWSLSEKIRLEQMIKITYKAPKKNVKSHIVLPSSLYYDAHYFYLVAYHSKYEGYRTFRIDRIQHIRPSDEKKPNISYGNKYRDGDVRNQKVDAFEGNRISVTFIYKGNQEIIFDQFPKAEIISKKEDEYSFQIETQYTPGLKRWILGQGKEIRVLKPQKLVNDVKESLELTLKNY